MEMLQAYRALLTANIPVKLESLPGVGKTQYQNALVEATGGYMHTMVAVVQDPTDFGGIPFPNQDGGFYDLLPGHWAVQLAESVNNYPLSVLFLDEVNTASRMVLSALLKVVDERRVGNFQLPPQVRIVMAMNPAEANGGVDLTPAMANRTAHLPFDIPVTDWAKGLAAGFPAPAPIDLFSDEELDDAARSNAALVSQFIMQNRVGFVDAYPSDPNERSKAWPSRRTWTLACRAAGAVDLLGYGMVVKEQVITSLVGKKAAGSFMDWVEMQQDISLDDVFADPANAALPDEESRLFAVLERLADEVVQNPSTARVQAACVYMQRIADSGKPGTAAGAMRKVAEVVMSDTKTYLTPEVRATLQVFKPVIESLGV